MQSVTRPLLEVPSKAAHRPKRTLRNVGYGSARTSRFEKRCWCGQRMGVSMATSNGSVTSRKANCSCGSLTLALAGDPRLVVACHCRECQRRTGSVFGVGAYFLRAQVQAAGPFNVYVRDARDGRKARLHFCPTCGSTVFWELDLRPEVVGVAVGALADPHFAAPTVSTWETSRHPWVAFEHEIARLSEQF
jgi:hypothetical protein